MKPRSIKHRKQPKIEKVHKRNDHFDQQEQNLDVLEMEEHNDEHYNALLKSSPHANLKKNAYFFNNQRYTATKEPQPQEESQQSQEEAGQTEDVKNYLTSALKELKQERIKKSKLLTEDVRRIEEEDEKFETIRKQQKTSDEAIQESVCLKGQLDLFKDIIDLRYNKQNELETLKRFPVAHFPKDQPLNKTHKTLERHLFDNLNSLIDLYDQYANKVFPEGHQAIPSFSEQLQEELQQGKSFEESSLAVESMFLRFTQSQHQLTKQTEKQLVKWSQKTALLNVSSSHYSSLLMQTPVGQAKKIVEQWPRASSKCQQKRSNFKILFQADEDVRNSSHPQIYDDFQLFNELEKVYVSEVNDQNDFRISDTLRYLKNREARGEKAKEVDRKASKNRKLRFNVHPKLLNFMPGRPSNEIQARDEIVENMFNCRSGQPQKAREEETYYIDM